MKTKTLRLMQAIAETASVNKKLVSAVGYHVGDLVHNFLTDKWSDDELFDALTEYHEQLQLRINQVNNK